MGGLGKSSELGRTPEQHTAHGGASPGIDHDHGRRAGGETHHVSDSKSPHAWMAKFGGPDERSSAVFGLRPWVTGTMAQGPAQCVNK